MNKTEDYIDVCNSKEGIKKYDRETFEKDKPFIKKSINLAINNNIRPNIGEIVYGNFYIYYIVNVYFHRDSTMFCVDYYDRE